MAVPNGAQMGIFHNVGPFAIFRRRVDYLAMESLSEGRLAINHQDPSHGPSSSLQRTNNSFPFTVCVLANQNTRRS